MQTHQTAVRIKIQEIKKNTKVVIVKTVWNEKIVEVLAKDCVTELKKHKNIKVEELVVPGAIEIPFVINQYAKHDKNIGAFIALGCVIKGNTPHFDYVCYMLCNGLSKLNICLNVPSIMGVLTVNTVAQAKERTIRLKKGAEFARSAVSMIYLNQQLN